MKRIYAMAVVCALSASPLAAQETREQIDAQQRSDKAQNAPVEESRPGVFARTLSWATTKVDGVGTPSDGFYARLGGPVPGTGWLSGGPGYRHHVFGQAAIVDTFATISSQHSSMLQSGIEWPALLSDRLAIGGLVTYQDLTAMHYYGIGSQTSSAGRTDYRLQNVDALAMATLRLAERFTAGARAGYSRTLDLGQAVGSSRSIDDVFDEIDAPGLNTQPRYRHVDMFAETDLGDVRGYPTSGGAYRVGLATFGDLNGSGHSFRRLDLDASQYIPVFHRNWVFAVRSRIVLSQTAEGQSVPFYLLPTIGGENSVRAYDEYRFRDRHTALLSAEYRWPLFRLMDAALFADAGAVAPTVAALWSATPKTGYGFGLRVHSPTRSLATIDVAKGREGTRIVATLHTTFGGSNRSIVPYVP
jgi:outer membrane protein assembly factor BamA